MSEIADTATEQALRAEVEELTRANRVSRSVENERRIRDLRHQIAIELFRRPAVRGSFPEPDFDHLDTSSAVPEVAPEDLTAEVVRAAITERGCLLVRGLVEREEALRLEREIEAVFSAREAARNGDQRGDGYYEEIRAQEPYTLEDRGWVTEAGGVWAADSPKLMFDVLEMFERRGLRDVIRAYLGEPPALSVQKCTLRKVAPTAGNGFPGWHQDGRFLGDVRALNVWLTLTHCGDDQAPGMDLVPRRIDEFLPTGTEGAIFDWIVAPDMVEQARGTTPIVRPVFEPGDVLLFDDVFLHSTAADPSMPNHRYAIESWFFGPSGFPEKYAPLAL